MAERKLREDLFSFAFIKKSVFTGSYHGMQYRVGKEDEHLAAWTFPEPYAFAYTPEEQKTKQEFSFDEAGYAQAIDWLEEQFAARKW